MPKVSICSATYNHEKYAVDSINSLLHQSFGDFELIMCDDASTDRNVEQIRSVNDSRLRLMINEENMGYGATSTRCWEASNGEYISMLATDDMYEPHMLQVLVEYLDQNPKVGGVLGLARYVDDDGKLTGESWTDGGVGLDRYQLLNCLFYQKGYFCAPAAMIRRSFLEEVGYIPAQLMQLNDMAHWIRMLFHGELRIINEHVVKYRLRANQANLSAPKPEVWYRHAFETFEVLSLYSTYIQDIELLTKIFPEVQKNRWPKENRLTHFHLAQLALQFEHPSWHFFGLHLLHRLLSNPEMARYIKQTCNFGYADLFRLETEKHPIDTVLPDLYAKTIEELNVLRSQFCNLQWKTQELVKDQQSISHWMNEAEPRPLPGSENILFGNVVRLLRMFSWKCSAGIQFLAQWCADEDPSLATNVGVHVIDASGKILSQADRKLSPILQNGKNMWSDCFMIRSEQLSGAKGIAIAVYEDPNRTQLIQGGRCDWDNHRLLLPLCID